MLKIVPVIFILLMFSSCDSRIADTKQVSEPTVKSYEPTDLFEYKLPNGWLVNSKHKTAAKLVLMDTINIASINVQTDYPVLTEFNIDKMLSELGILYPDIEIFEHNQFEIDEQLAYQINYGIGRNEYMNFSTVGIRSDEFLAIFTLTCSKDNYQTGLNSFDKLIKSIKVK